VCGTSKRSGTRVGSTKIELSAGPDIEREAAVTSSAPCDPGDVGHRNRWTITK
jgi:hypothetical protein